MLSRRFARFAARSALISCAVLVVGFTGTALATTADYDGATLVITGGDNAAHDIQFRLSADQAHDEIIDTVNFTSIPADCTVITANTWISCPSHTDVKVDLGAGGDSVTFGGQLFDCFDQYTLNLGEGVNTLNLSDSCPDTPTDAATVNSGSGADTLTGGSQAPVTFFAGGGNDNVYGGSGDDVLHGGAGDDRLFGHAGHDQVFGESGADSPNGGTGNDVVDGGEGDDSLELCSSCAGSGNDTGAGADTYVGGPGTDRLWLDAHPGGLSISIDGQANDGTPGEGDNVGSDIEGIEGSGGDDHFTGSDGPDSFSGGSGNDDIHGGGGADDLYGGGGDDKLYGDAGDDRVQGASGADTVDGGSGADHLYGDIAACSVFCSFDSDTLLARDGETDAVDCGGGADSAQVDFSDVVAFCTSVDRSPAPSSQTPATQTPAANTPAAAVAALQLKVVASIKSKLLRSRGLAIALTCPAACTVRAQLSYKAKKLGSAKTSLLHNGRVKLVLKLSSKGKRIVKKLRRGKLTLRITVTDAAGHSTPLKKLVALTS